jgi:RES domain
VKSAAISEVAKGLARLGATAEVIHCGLPYSVPQAWSKELYAHPITADGIAYDGRLDSREVCYAIFDRAQGAIEEIERDKNLDADWFWQLATLCGVGLSPL